MKNSCLYQDRPRTFRRSSKTILGEKNHKNIGWGTNLQNINKDIRSMYHPDGFSKELTAKCKYWLETQDDNVFTEEELIQLNVFAQSDQDGAEARIVAYECKNGMYRQLFENNVKPHVFVAMHLFKSIWPKKLKESGGIVIDMDELCATPISNLKLNPNWKELDKIIKSSDNWSIQERYYYLAKQTCHSANYGIEWSTFMMNILEKSGGKIVLEKDKAQFFLRVYRSLFPEIPERNDRIRIQAEKDRMLFNMFGHPYIITSYNILESTFKELYAWSAQSTVGEITRTAICEFQEVVERTGLKWDFMQDGHDSFLTQGNLFTTKERCSFMQTCLGQELTSPVDGVKFRMKSEVQVGFNWGVYDKNNPEKNPLGLRIIDWKN